MELRDSKSASGTSIVDLSSVFCFCCCSDCDDEYPCP